MKKSAFAITPPSSHKGKRTANVWAYLILLALAFCFFSLYAGVTKILFSPNKVDIFKNDLTQIATYFWPVDRQVSQKLLLLNDLLKSYAQGENIFKEKSESVDELRKYITNNKQYLANLGFQNYESLIKFLADAYQYREEIYMLLWKDQPFNYLVLLQNGNEKRPNGGFFGSFAFVTIDGGHISNLEVIDSYLPEYIAPTTRIQLPTRFTDAFGESEAGFIAGNKFWFTDMDGKNIKLLYEKIFNQEYDSTRVSQMFSPEQRELLHNKYIKGIVFLDSELLRAILPWFLEKSRERQFVNASIDIIRGEEKSNKKEFYIKEVLEYFDQHKSTLAKNLINNWETILSKRYIQLYFSNITSPLQSFLINAQLQTPYSADNIYTWDINTAFNKSDAFIKKSVQLLLPQGNSISSTENDIINISQLLSGEYRIQIDYDFNVPDYYINFIRQLEKKYKITLTPREEDILVLWAVQHTNKQIPRRRETRGVLYIPTYIEITNVQGDAWAYREFSSDFSKGLIYRISTNQNNSTLQLLIDIKVYPH